MLFSFTQVRRRSQKMKRLERPSNITDHVIIHSCPSDGRLNGSLTSPHPPSPVTQLMFLAALGWPVSPLRPPWHPPPSTVTFPTFPVTRTCRPVSFSSERATRGRDISLSACLIRNSLAVGLTALIERARQEPANLTDCLSPGRDLPYSWTSRTAGHRRKPLSTN